MIEAVLKANDFPEATEWIYQPHVHKEIERHRRYSAQASSPSLDRASGLDGIVSLPS